ncbi:MAG: hypothetical protein GC145_06170 [Caulobacter sp.]|nr:hypothetical protein [Caulobacter sp.]
MPSMPPTFRCHARPDRERERDNDRRRGSARERGYNTAWAKASKGHLRSHPLCEYCALDGVVRQADLTDHLFPHKGDKRVFWFKPWWVSSCKTCHDGPKQQIERRGLAALTDLARRLGRPEALPAEG